MISTHHDHDDTIGKGSMSAQDSAAPGGPATDDPATDERERLRRWRLLLGSSDDEGGPTLSAADQAIDAALAALYNEDAGAGAGGGRDVADDLILVAKLRNADRPVRRVKRPGTNARGSP